MKLLAATNKGDELGQGVFVVPLQNKLRDDLHSRRGVGNKSRAITVNVKSILPAVSLNR